MADVGCWRRIFQGAGVASGTSMKKWPWGGAVAAVLGSGQGRPEMEVVAVSFSTRLLEASGGVYMNCLHLLDLHVHHLAATPTAARKPNPNHVAQAFWQHWAQDHSSMVLRLHSASQDSPAHQVILFFGAHARSTVFHDLLI